MSASPTQQLSFLITGGLAVAGTVVGQLGATSATTLAGGGSGGIETSVFLSLMLAFAGVSTTATLKLAARWGKLRTFTLAQCGVAVSWTTVGILELLTDSSLVLMWLAAPIFGIFSGVTASLTPFATRSYLASASMASSMARRGTISGVAIALSAALAGYVIHRTEPGVGILANGVLTLPLVVFLLRNKLGTSDEKRGTNTVAIADLIKALRTSPKLREPALLTLLAMIFVVPMLNMMVPILNALEHSPLALGAGFVLAGIAAGRIVVPRLMKRLLKHQSEHSGAKWALVWASGFMIAFTATEILPVSDFDLLVWALMGAGLGASRFTFRPLVISAGAKSSPEDDELLGVVAVTTTGHFASPVGTLLWGLSIEYFSVPVTITVAALAMVASLSLLALSTNTARP